MDLTDRLPLPLRGPARQVLATLRASLWVLPALNSVAGVLVAVALLRWDPSWSWLSFIDDAEAARSAVATVVAAVVTATSLAVTATVVALQLAAGQFSPRLLRDALEDRGIQLVLTSFMGTITYGLTLIPQISGEEPPRLAVLAGIAAGGICVGMLIYFLRAITRRLRIEEVVQQIVEGTEHVVLRSDPRDPTDAPRRDDRRRVEVPDHALAVAARRSGYVQEVSLRSLAEVAASHRVHVHIRPRIGTFLVAGTPAASVWSADGDDVGDRLRDEIAADVDRALALGVDRTMSQDPSYGIRHLVDIALRAVSPSVNDPTTAVQCIDNATGLLVTFARHPVGDWLVEHDGCTASLSRPDLDDQLELAQTQLLRYGGDEPWVLDAMIRQLRDLLITTDDDATSAAVERRLEILRDHLATRAELTAHERRIVDTALAQLDDPDPDEDDIGTA